MKHRIAHEAASLDRLTDDERAWLATFPQIGRATAYLRHSLTTWYRRSTLVLPDGSGRATIDRDLVFALPNGRELALPGMAIIETKGSGKATSVDRLLWRSGHRPLSLSKFTAGLALLRPELPANRWHRVRTHLAAVAEDPEVDASTWSLLASTGG